MKVGLSKRTAAVTVSVTICAIVGLLAYAIHRHAPPPPSTSAKSHKPTAPEQTQATKETVPTKKPSPPRLLASFMPLFANGLITNEFAYWNPHISSAKFSPEWQMTSGSLFAKYGVFWTGSPDTCSNGKTSPNAASTNCTDSSVFRLNTTKRFSGNVSVSLALKQLRNIHNPTCNNGDTCWYGTHIWLRYQNQFNLYYVSVNRADGDVAIKRKVPCGTDNSGTYFVLGTYVKHGFQPNMWNTYTATIQTDHDGSVTIKLYDDSYSTTTPIDVGTDNGGTNPNWSASCNTPGHYSSSKYQPISTAGAVGIRGDYAEFEFTNFTVAAL